MIRPHAIRDMTDVIDVFAFGKYEILRAARNIEIPDCSDLQDIYAIIDGHSDDADLQLYLDALSGRIECSSMELADLAVRLGERDGIRKFLSFILSLEIMNIDMMHQMRDAIAGDDVLSNTLLTDYCSLFISIIEGNSRAANELVYDILSTVKMRQNLLDVSDLKDACALAFSSGELQPIQLGNEATPAAAINTLNYLAMTNNLSSIDELLPLINGTRIGTALVELENYCEP